MSSLRLGWRPLARTSKPSTSGACVCVCACYHSCGASKEGYMQVDVVVVVFWVCALYVCCKRSVSVFLYVVHSWLPSMASCVLAHSS